MTRLCLIGETDPFIARLLERFSEESGLHPLLAGTGQEVLRLARLHKPDVIVLDTELPGQMRGWEAAHALQGEPELCHIPLIVCAWLGEAEALQQAGHLSAYLQKPDLHFLDFVTALRASGLAAG